MANYTVKVPFSQKGVSEATKKLKFMQKNADKLRDVFIDMSLDFLEIEAAKQLEATVGGSDWYQVTGNLLASFRKDVAIGKLINEAYYSGYVEYGTGILGMSADGYVTNASGKGESGWKFMFDEEIHFTHGQHPHRFMQVAVENYSVEYSKIFEKAFKQVYGRALK